ncbi:hypothetical protein CKY51_08405 [Xanthomonas maliensis]|nr:hypothetical protein CKY51_08405 [Xanthomonas maliensis]
MSDAFPAAFRSFALWPALDVWPGYKEVEGSIGLVDDDGERVWLGGAGSCIEDAVEDALTSFVNWVVHPADVTEKNFCLRPAPHQDTGAID